MEAGLLCSHLEEEKTRAQRGGFIYLGPRGEYKEGLGANPGLSTLELYWLQVWAVEPSSMGSNPTVIPDRLCDVGQVTLPL